MFLLQGDLTALHYSAQKGHESITRVLIEDGGRVNALSIDKTTPLMLAVEYAHKKVVKLLLRKGADMHIVDKTGADALHRAAFISNPVRESPSRHVPPRNYVQSQPFVPFNLFCVLASPCLCVGSTGHLENAFGPVHRQR